MAILPGDYLPWQPTGVDGRGPTVAAAARTDGATQPTRLSSHRDGLRLRPQQVDLGGCAFRQRDSDRAGTLKAALSAFFAANQPQVYFVYGLVFFVLGLSILVQSRSHSRLSLARRLEWLAAFGLIHGAHEWGDLFMPIQATQVTPATADVLVVLHQLLLAASFVCLYQFAVTLLRPLPNGWAWLRWLPVSSVALWLGLTAAIREPGGGVAGWALGANIAARYAIGLPSALLAGLALTRRARRLVAPLDDPSTRAVLERMGLVMLAYAAASGLIVPPGPFSPADRINSRVIEAALGVPIPVYRSLIGLALVLSVRRTLDLFDFELGRNLGAAEEALVLEAERARIGRDLHDRTLQSVYAAGLVLTAAREAHHRSGADGIAENLDQALFALDRAIEDIRAHISELGSPPTVAGLAEGLQERVRASAVEAVATAEVRVDVPAGLRLDPRTVGHVLAIVSEALSNVARHSLAARVSLTACVEEGRLRLSVEDDGRGLPVDYVSGYGLRNMHDRARLLNGHLQINTAPGQGTRLLLTVPLAGLEARDPS